MKEVIWTVVLIVTQFSSFLAPPPIITEPKEALVPIFMYHDISESGEGEFTIAADDFEAHIKALSDAGVEGVSFQDLINFVYYDGDLPEKPVVITFDDGYASNYELAYPILEKYNMKATLFLIGITVGANTYPNTDHEIYPHFSFEDAQIMLDSGLIEIQSHSYNLHQWPSLEVGVARYNALPLEGETPEEHAEVFIADFLRSKEEIEGNTSSLVQVFCYPGGAYSAHTEAMLAEMGVLVTVTVDLGTNTLIQKEGEGLFALKRYSMDSVTDIDFVLQCAGVLEDTESFDEPEEDTESLDEPEEDTESLDEPEEDTESLDEPEEDTESLDEPEEDTESFDEPEEDTESFEDLDEEVLEEPEGYVDTDIFEIPDGYVEEWQNLPGFVQQEII
ncbi:MAG: polysaccharide deacetylase family protein [Eubacteriales bacterium]